MLALQLRLSEIENENKSSEESLSEQLTLLREQLQLEEGEREKHVLSLKQQLEASRNQIGQFKYINLSKIEYFNSCTGTCQSRTWSGAAHEGTGSQSLTR